MQDPVSHNAGDEFRHDWVRMTNSANTSTVKAREFQQGTEILNASTSCGFELGPCVDHHADPPTSPDCVFTIDKERYRASGKVDVLMTEQGAWPTESLSLPGLSRRPPRGLPPRA
jgi:hypothetical protein